MYTFRWSTKLLQLCVKQDVGILALKESESFLLNSKFKATPDKESKMTQLPNRDENNDYQNSEEYRNNEILAKTTQ